MGMSRCYSMMKCLLILFNVIFLFVGVGVCAFATWALWDGRASETGSGRAGLCALAVWAIVLSLGAITALAGAIRGSASLLAASFALLALSAVAQGAAAWWGAAHLPQLRRALHDQLLHTIAHEYGVLPARTNVVDAIQHGLQCCGADSARDWQAAAWSSDTLDLSVAAPPTYYMVPPSCCVSSEAAECEAARRVVSTSSGGAGVHGAGCGARAAAAVERAARGPLLGGAALLAAHLAALLLALALCLAPAHTNNYKA